MDFLLQEIILDKAEVNLYEDLLVHTSAVYLFISML